MSNPASPIRPDQLLQDAENRLVTDAQITQWNAGGGGTVLERIIPVTLLERSVYSSANESEFPARTDDTITNGSWFTLNYPASVPSYATSVILSCTLGTTSAGQGYMYMRKNGNFPKAIIIKSWDDTANTAEIEIPYHSDRNFEVKIDADGIQSYLIEVVGYRRSTVIDALALSNTDPLADGTASPGSSLYVSRADHVHPKSGGSITMIDPVTLIDYSGGLPGVGDTNVAIPQIPTSATAVIVTSRMILTGGPGGVADAGLWGKTPSGSYIELALGRKDDSSSADSNMTFLQVTAPQQITYRTGSSYDPLGGVSGGFASITRLIGYIS